MIEDRKFRAQLQECGQNYMLGVLATNPDEFPNSGEDPNSAVTIMRNAFKICFYINPISFQPEPIIELDYLLQERALSTVYIGMEESFPRNYLSNMSYTYTTDIEQKLQKIKEKLEGKIIVFRPRITFTSDGKVFKNLDIISLEDMSSNIALDAEFMPIPIYQRASKFEESIKESKVIHFKDFYHNMIQPDYAISDNYIYSFVDGWKKDSSRKNGWLYTSPDEVIKLRINDDELNKHQVIASPDHLVFVETGYLIGLHDQFASEGTKLHSSESMIEEEMEQVPAVEASSANSSSITASEVEVMAPKVINDSIARSAKPVSRPASDVQKLEGKFLLDLERNALVKRLCYERKDLVNFHISVKTNSITILSGMSGTGKSQLALLYAKTLGLSKEEGTLLVLPISPSYTEPEDIIGYHNTSAGLYIPSETGLVDFLIHAKNHGDQMHMVVFDEMNLSQVEYWFAPFISLLEMDGEESYRELKLWSKDSVCHNQAKYPQTIPIGDNVIFIGTANMDETTKDFSDRLLDRANIVMPRKMKFVTHKRSIADSRELQDQMSDDFAELYRNRETYRAWNFNKDTWSAFNESELGFFDSLHETIQRFDSQKGVSFRALERIGMYLNNIPLGNNQEAEIERQDAIDLQVKQRILTKIRGSVEQYGDLIGVLASQESVPTGSELYDLFTGEDAQTISHFKLSIEEIKRKARELHINDYAS